MKVHFEEYPLDPTIKLLKRGLTIAQWTLQITFMVGPEKVFGYLGMPVPGIITMAHEKVGKFMLSMGVMMGGNFLQGRLGGTGAFEVFQGFEGDEGHRQLFSKLGAKRFPAPEEIIASFANK